MPAATARLPLAAFAALFVGYACSYFHRADLSVVAPVWDADPAHAALRAALPDIASLGMLVYAMGKVIGGLLAERYGGQRVFVAALAGAGIAEVAAAFADAPLPFALCRVAGMAVLGWAWPALGSVVAATTTAVRLATVMAFLSQSYLLGDAAVRAVLAAVVANGGTGRSVLGTAAGGLLAASLFAALLLWRAHVHTRRAAPRAQVAADAAGANGALRRALLFFAAMNFGLAAVREALSLWTPTLLVELCRAPTDDAVRASALLPVASGFGALLAGAGADRGPRALLAVTVLPAWLGAAALAALAAVPAPHFELLLVALAFIAALLMMPMTLASGVLPLRAAPHGGARRLGFVDGAGSLGAVLAGTVLARVMAAWGASGLFATMAAIAAIAGAFALAAHRVSVGAPRTPAAPLHR